MVSGRATTSFVDGMQPLSGTDVPGRLSSGRVLERPENGSGDSQRGYLHRMPVLHVELFLRSSAIQSRTRRGRQMRYVPQPAGGGPRTGVRGGMPRGGNSNRDRKHRRVEARLFGERE